MTGVIRAESMTVGKTTHRNDDFAFHTPIFGYRMLGVLGDFTSDSPRGVNEGLLKSLEGFVAERMTTWREMLLPAERLLPLLARHINEWLGGYASSAHTTLIAFVWDLRDGRVTFISVGDSGLAVAGGSGVRFLRTGDREGIRIAAGFLPTREPFRTESAPVARDEVVFAFTDGLWENTRAFLDDGLLAEVLGAGDLSAVTRAVKDRVFGPASREDDLTVLIMLGETMNRDLTAQSSNLSSRDLEERIERAVARAMGSPDSCRASPLDQELIQLMGDARAQYDRLEEEMMPRVEQMVGKQVETTMRKVLKGLEKRIEDRMADMTRKHEEARRELRELSPNTAVREMIKEEIGKAMGGRRDEARLKKPSATGTHNVIKGRKDQNGVADVVTFLNQNIWIPITLALVLVALVVYIAWPSGEPEPPQADPVAQSSAPPQPTEEQVVEPDPEPERPAPEPPTPSYQPAPMKAEALTLLGVTPRQFAEEAHAIHEALEAIRAEPPNQREIVSVSVGGSLGDIAVTVTPNAGWLTGETLPLGIPASMWLQAELGVGIDGAPGPGTKSAFIQALDSRVKARQRLAAHLAEESPVLAELDEAFRDSFDHTEGAYDEALMGLARRILDQGNTVGGFQDLVLNGQKIKARYRNDANQYTALGTWRNALEGKTVTTADIGLPIRVLFIAAEAGLGGSDGTATDELRQKINPFGATTAGKLFDEVVAAWK